MREVVFVDFARTAFCKPGGSLRSFSACTIGAECLKGLAAKSGIWERGGTVDSVFAGSVFRNKDSAAPVRYMTLLAGFPIETEGHQVELQEGSALAAINHAACQIALGYVDVAMAGGMESASTRPVFMSSVAEPYTGTAPAWLDMKLSPYPEQNISQREASILLAAKCGLVKSECEDYAQRSRQNLQAAYEAGLAGSDIVPMVIPATRKTPEVVIDQDQQPDSTSTDAALADGAAFVLMMTAEKAKELGYTPYARWVMGADIGVEPRFAGLGAIYAGLKALKLAGLTPDDVDVWECSELSAEQNLAAIRELEEAGGCTIDKSKWNPNGGAVALGLPGGACGAQMAQFAMKHLKTTGGRYGLICASCGGGQGATTIIERL